MTKGKKIATVLAILLAAALVSGLTAMAVSSYGSQEDPLVTLSYLNETVTPAILEQLNAALNEQLAGLQAKLDELAAQSESPGSDGTVPSGFVVLTLSKDQTVTCGVGTEIMPRLGAVVSYGPNSPRLVDETDAASVTDAGAALVTNHMYMVTIKGNGVTATHDNTKILIRGDYTIS